MNHTEKIQHSVKIRRHVEPGYLVCIPSIITKYRGAEQRSPDLFCRNTERMGTVPPNLHCLSFLYCEEKSFLEWLVKASLRRNWVQKHSHLCVWMTVKFTIVRMIAGHAKL